MMATGTQEIPQSVQADPDDALLVKRFQRGEESAFNHLVIRYQTTIYQLAQRYTTKHEDTLDITQDVFLKAYRRLPRFNGQCQFYTWIYRITINLCIDHTRQQIRCRNRRINTSKSTDDLLAEVVDLKFPPPTRSIETEELLAHFRTAMLQLPPQQHQVFILRHQDGMKLSEIARKLKRSVGTVKAHLFNARKCLQKEIFPYLRGEL